jgi:flagellar motility protein MotE (MotC chaperone)
MEKQNFHKQIKKEIKDWEEKHGDYDRLTGIPLKLKKDAKVPVIPKSMKS